MEKRLCKTIYFRQHVKGRLEVDRLGRLFEKLDDACAHAVHLTPTALGNTADSVAANAYLTTEVSDGERTLCVVRGTVYYRPALGRLNWWPFQFDLYHRTSYSAEDKSFDLGQAA